MVRYITGAIDTLHVNDIFTQITHYRVPKLHVTSRDAVSKALWLSVFRQDIKNTPRLKDFSFNNKFTYQLLTGDWSSIVAREVRGTGCAGHTGFCWPYRVLLAIPGLLAIRAFAGHTGFAGGTGFAGHTGSCWPYRVCWRYGVCWSYRALLAIPGLLVECVVIVNPIRVSSQFYFQLLDKYDSPAIPNMCLLQ